MKTYKLKDDGVLNNEENITIEVSESIKVSNVITVSTIKRQIEDIKLQIQSLKDTKAILIKQLKDIKTDLNLTFDIEEDEVV
jgi:hypothetical protein